MDEERIAADQMEQYSTKQEGCRNIHTFEITAAVCSEHAGPTVEAPTRAIMAVRIAEFLQSGSKSWNQSTRSSGSCCTDKDV